jgi:hypothetical protein
LEGLRRHLALLPSDIIKIETERMLDPHPLYLICRYLECDIPDIIDFLGYGEEDIFYSRTVLESRSYTPKTYRKKEFKSDVFQ